MTTKPQMFILLVLSVLAVPRLLPADEPQVDPWANLNDVTHGRTYTFVGRGGYCVHGKIIAVTDQSVTVKFALPGRGRPQYTTRTFERATILRVKDGPGALDVVYIAQSSWSGLKPFRDIAPDERMLVITKDGKRHNGKFVEVSESRLRVALWNKTVGIAKDDVACVYYVRTKPLTDEMVYEVQELVLLDPRLWPYLLRIPPKISVRVYDSSVPEGDAPFQCKSNPGFNQITSLDGTSTKP